MVTRDPTSTLDGFLRDASFHGEVAVARLRVALCTLAMCNLLFLADGGSRLLSGDPKYWLMSIVMTGGILFSGLYLRYGSKLPLAIEASVVSDGLLATVVVGSIVYWPSPHFHGLTTVPHAFAFCIAMISAGFRLSNRAVFLSAVVNLSGVAALLILEQERVAGSHDIPLDDYGVFWVMNVLSVLLALAIVRRTRSLVQKGSTAVLDSERARQRLGMYVSQVIAEQAMASEELKPGGQRRHVAVLFSDLRDFTRYSERLGPEQLVQELNAYLEAMLTEISAEGGVVDKYIGDAIMVVFGLPAARSDDAARAVRAAARMQLALARHNEERAGRGQPPLRQGIGVHWGEVVAGNVGTTERLQYTVMGDTVNTASRIQSATKELGYSVLISAETAAATSGQQVPPLSLVGPLAVRGRETPLQVYRLQETT